MAVVKIINFVKHRGRAAATLTCLFASASLSGCTYFQDLRSQRHRAETDLESICKKIPVPDTFASIGENKNLDLAKVVLFRRYRTRDSCQLAEEHFRNYFIAEGWDPNRMETKESRGGTRSLSFFFRDGEYLVWVDCQDNARANEPKDLIISCSWGLR